jgi:hypothetical protein
MNVTSALRVLFFVIGAAITTQRSGLLHQNPAGLTHREENARSLGTFTSWLEEILLFMTAPYLKPTEITGQPSQIAVAFSLQAQKLMLSEFLCLDVYFYAQGTHCSN